MSKGAHYRTPKKHVYTRTSVHLEITLHLVAISVYFARLDVGKFLLLSHLEDGVDAGHIAGDVLVQLPGFSHQSNLVVVHSHQRVEQLFELFVKLLHAILADYLRKRLQKSVRNLPLLLLLCNCS